MATDVDSLRVVRVEGEAGSETYELVRDGVPVPPVDRFLQFLADRNMSPNTQRAYAYDLRHFLRFLAVERNEWREFRARDAPALLHYLRHVRSGGYGRRADLRPVSSEGGEIGRLLAPASVHRILAAVASFYEWAIAVGEYGADSPLQRHPDDAARRVSDRHQPFTGLSSRQRPIRRLVGVRRPLRLPRPMADDDLEELFASFQRWRDRAMFLLMLDGGLRPGEVLSLHVTDVSYRPGRVLVAKRDDHPRGARGKSRIERFVDLADLRTLAAVSRYVMDERPPDSPSPFLFLVGGNRSTREQPLTYAALVRLFARHLDNLGRRTASTTPHALRHTHATAMWDGGMRELTLQKRLGPRVAGIHPDLHPRLRFRRARRVPGRIGARAMTAAGRPVVSHATTTSVSHVPRADYGRWLREDLRCSADLTRQRLRHYDLFTSRWPDLADWLNTPLLDRVAVEALNRHEIGCVTRPNNGGVPTPYLTFASFRHGVRLDTPLLLMLKVAFALRPDAMPALGLDPDAFALHRDRLVQLGYSRAGAHGTVSWGLPRLAMWRGDPNLSAITADDLERFAAEVKAFHETTAALAVSRMRARATDRSPDRDAAGWAANRRHYQISRVFMLHVLLFNTGQVDRPPDRGARPARSWRDEIVPPGTPAAMVELASRWLQWRESVDTTSSGGAARRSRDALRCLISYLRAEQPEIDSFDQVTRAHIEGFLQHLAHRRAAVTGKPLSLSYRRIVIGALRSFVQQANEMGWPGAPARNLLLPADQPRQPRALPRYVPEDELNRLMVAVAALDDPQQRAALLLLRWSGARRDEIRRLDLDCLDHYPDGHPRLRIPVGKGLEERAIPLHPEAADALRELIELARAAGGAPRWDRRAGRHVRYVFSTRGQLRSPTFLFNESLAIACERAGLVDQGRAATITAHRFRHTVGTQLAEGGARLQTIMAILGHRSPQMAMTYTHLSDPTIRREYERVLGSGERIAGPALETLLDPMRITDADVDWLKTNFVKTELELGHCLRLPQEGPCECDLYLRCPKFLTTSAYAPRLRDRLGVEQTLINDAHQRGWQREVERHTAVSERIKELLDELGELTP